MHNLENWQEEKSAAYLYQILEKYESNPAFKNLFNKLNIAALDQAAIWEKEIKKNDPEIVLHYHPDVRTKLVGFLVKIFGIKPLRIILTAMKVRGMSVYGETTHFAFEERHKSIQSGGNLRAAVFGINDGLISNISLILGVAGASHDIHFILISGTAGLLAGACSMASGEYVSVRSQRELYENQIELERKELELYPQEEILELTHIYEARGISATEARQLAQKIITDPEKALDTLSKEELGINPQELSSPWGAAIASFLAFAFGALIPLLPFLFQSFPHQLLYALILTGFSLFAVGASISLYTNKSALYSGSRMLIIGIAAGAITFFIGKLVGATLF